MSVLRVRYDTVEFGDLDVHLRSLRDKQEFRDDDGEAEDLGIHSASWPLFGVLWDAGKVLARMMADYDVEGLRVLEVGCGLGLASLVLNSRDADITATDHNPEAERFLAYNVRLNEGTPIPFERTGWMDDESEIGQFDLIIGSDLLYERNHAAELAHFIGRHATPSCEAIIADSQRGHAGRFRQEMQTLGYDHSERELSAETRGTWSRGKVHAFTR